MSRRSPRLKLVRKLEPLDVIERRSVHPLVAEYEETLQELCLDYPKRQCVDWVVALQGVADLVFPVDRATGQLSDPFDEMVLECAHTAGSDFIVSGGKRRLLPLGSFRGILIVAPSDLLRRI